MPMQPSPSRETVRPWLPSWTDCTVGAPLGEDRCLRGASAGARVGLASAAIEHQARSLVAAQRVRAQAGHARGVGDAEGVCDGHGTQARTSSALLVLVLVNSRTY